MEQAVLDQRKNVDDLIKLINKINDTEKLITDKHLRMDLIVIMGQHRHSFEEQKVCTHDKCVSFQVIGGSESGLIGGMMLLCDRRADFRNIVMETANYIVLKSIS